LLEHLKEVAKPLGRVDPLTDTAAQVLAAQK
jgi:hypothetical protein